MHLAVISSVGRLCWLIWREPVWYWCDMTSCQELKCECWPDEESEDHQSCHVSSWWEREHLNRSCRFSIRVMDDTPTQPSIKHLATRWRNVRGSAERNPPLDTWTCEPTVRLHVDPPCSGGDHFTPDQHADILKRMKDAWLLIAVSMWR